jgi:hypothetical protein
MITTIVPLSVTESRVTIWVAGFKLSAGLCCVAVRANGRLVCDVCNVQLICDG